MTQKFVSKGSVVAEGSVKIRFKKRKPKGSVPVAELYQKFEVERAATKMTALGIAAKEIESELCAK